MRALFDKSEPIEISPVCSAKLASFSFLASVLVVMIHARCFLYGTSCSQTVMRLCLTEGITQLAVPFFFVVSGFLLAGRMEQRGWWWLAMKSRLMSLGVPYVLWNVLFTIATFAVLWVSGRYFSDSVRENLMSSVQCGMERWLRFPVLQDLWVSADGPMWYVRSLLILVAVSPIYSFLRFDRYGILLSALYVVMFFLVFIVAPGVPWWSKFLWTTLEWRGCLYFGVGIWLRYHSVGVSRNVCWFLLGVSVMMWLIGCKVEQPWVIRYFWIPVSIGSLWLLVPSLHIPKAVCALSFPVFVIHSFFIWIMKGVLDYRHPSESKYLIAVVVTLSMSMLSILLMRRLVPKASRILFGGR